MESEGIETNQERQRRTRNVSGASFFISNVHIHAQA